jgi:PD-(D/E)XK nuclease family transposase
MISKYFNPYTDFGFKKLFGEEGSKDLLLDFLNQLLPAHHQIAQLSFKNPENFSNTVEERKAIFDIYCESASGERFIVEMQKAKMHFFKDRSLFYSTFPIREQSQKGLWDFRLLPVYFIAILDFIYDEQEDERKFRRDVCLKSVLSYNEAKAVTDTAFADGKSEGKIEGKIEGEKAKALDVARAMLAKGFDIDMIAEISTLSTEEIKSFYGRTAD